MRLHRLFHYHFSLICFNLNKLLKFPKLAINNLDIAAVNHHTRWCMYMLFSWLMIVYYLQRTSLMKLSSIQHLSLNVCIHNLGYDSAGVEYSCFSMSSVNPASASPLYIWDPYVVSTVSADGPAPNGAGPSAGIVLTTKLDMFSSLDSNDFQSSSLIRWCDSKGLTRSYKILQQLKH